MTSTILQIDNLKCGGCESTVTKAVSAFNGVHQVSASADDGSVRFSFEGQDTVVEEIKNKLSAIGYPPRGTSNTFQKAVSYVSCAKGKIAGK